jgi:hypothetical protein
MKIIDLAVTKDGLDLTCRVTLEDGSQIGSDLPWRNPLGIWASDDDARSPAEVAAVLRNFARAIEDAAARAKAA